MSPELFSNKDLIKQVTIEEKDKWVKTLTKGEKEYVKAMNKAIAFRQNLISRC